MAKYTEIFRLKRMLEESHIPFEFFDRSQEYSASIGYNATHYQICYPVEDGEYRICSVIQGARTYGGKKNLLEIMGLNNSEGLVEGHLSAEEVYFRISEHWEEHKNDT